MRKHQRTARRYPGRPGVICALESSQLRLIGELRDLSQAGFALTSQVERHSPALRYLTPILSGQHGSLELLWRHDEAQAFCKQRVIIVRSEYHGGQVTVAGRFASPLSHDWLSTFTLSPAEQGNLHITNGVLAVEGTLNFRNALHINRAANRFSPLQLDFAKVDRIDFSAVAITFNLLKKKNARLMNCHPAIRGVMQQGRVCSVCAGNCRRHGTVLRSPEDRHRPASVHLSLP